MTYAQDLDLNPVGYTKKYIVCDVPVFVQENFYGDVQNFIDIRATCNVINGKGSDHFIKSSVRIGMPFIDLTKLDEWPEYKALIMSVVDKCELIYPKYLQVGVTSDELDTLQAICGRNLANIRRIDI